MMVAGSKQSGGTIERRIVQDVVRQHAEQAAFFWAQRDTLAAEDPPDGNVVAGVDRRLEPNLDGLRISGTAAWPFIEAAYEDFPEKGELFLFAWLAIEQDNDSKVRRAVELGRASDDDARGLVGALAWHKAETISPLVRRWISAQDAFLRYLAVATCREHGVDPKSLLTNLLRDPDGRVRANSLHLAGVLKRADLTHDVISALDSDDGRVRLWAAWALNELGRGDLARAELRKVAAANGPNALTALRALIQAGPQDDVRAFMGGLLKSPDTTSLAVRGAGMLGDRSILPWLVQQMRAPALAVAAGGALLETFPEARGIDGLFTLDPTTLGPDFEEHFGDFAVKVPVAENVRTWSDSVLQK
ncbi:HEAT repeat domain-containing protein [Mesorhizobium neociceri]|uniref:HEAT repeat domain-containing protein n=1 Tax=Mesorhizobium neociceri TaxID=1307853 RepID=A0A838B6L6_9HYPH|nr:HEAT repeat domain-containing protein [Mesorhizobium neociceri]MBA1141631.1 HEAT repeat domain-containing protein [Mesorhizobium neociceri]